MRVKLTKLRDNANPRHPNNIAEGHVVEGDYRSEPKLGEAFCIDNYDDNNNRVWCTSTVQEIINEHTFRTHNSIYRWELVPVDAHTLSDDHVKDTPHKNWITIEQLDPTGVVVNTVAMAVPEKLTGMTAGGERPTCRYLLTVAGKLYYIDPVTGEITKI